MAKQMPDSIYCKLLKLTRQKEDFFTESLAYALQKDRAFLNGFVQLIAGNNLLNIPESKFEVKTQVSVPFGRLDMVLIIDGKTNLVIENKLWSKEGEGQLFKYISNDEIDHLAFITAESGYKVDRKVLNSQKYLRPKDAEHFTWDTVFPVLEQVCGRAESHYSIAELRSLFAYLGFTRKRGVTTGAEPKLVKTENTVEKTSAEEVLVYDRKSAENIFTLQTSVQETFQKIVKDNQSVFENTLLKYRWGTLGNKTKEIGNKHGQIYAYNMDFTEESRLIRLYVTPTKEGNALRVRLTTHNKADFPVFVDELEKKLENYSFLYELNADNKKHEHVEVVIPLVDMPNDLAQAGEYLLYLLEIVLKSTELALVITEG